MKYALWTLQILLALLFIFAGGSKLFMSPEDVAKNAPQFSGAFMRFLGVMELLGGLGLILPGLTGIRTELTPLAALGLLIIMIGAVVVTFMGGQTVVALVNIVFVLLLASIAYGRWRVLPLTARRPA